MEQKQSTNHEFWKKNYHVNDNNIEWYYCFQMLWLVAWRFRVNDAYVCVQRFSRLRTSYTETKQFWTVYYLLTYLLTYLSSSTQGTHMYGQALQGGRM